MSLLYKPLDSITAADLQGLIDNQVPESLYIEYKLEVFDKPEEKKRLQFLGSISGFSNGVGGDLLIGVRAVDGIPVELVGLEQTEADGETLRIQQVVGTSIEPQVRMTIRPILLSNARTVLIIRLPQSWTAPHGIKKDGHYQFYRRNSAGRSPMTIPELRNAFSLASTIAEHTRRFHCATVDGTQTGAVRIPSIYGQAVCGSAFSAVLEWLRSVERRYGKPAKSWVYESVQKSGKRVYPGRKYAVQP